MIASSRRALALLALLAAAGCDAPSDEAHVGEPIEPFRPGPQLELFSETCVLGRPSLVPPPDSRRVVSLAFLQDGRRLALAGEGGGLLVWDLEPGAPPREVDYAGARVVELAADAEGRLLAIAPVGGRPRLVAGPGASDLDPALPAEGPVWRAALDAAGGRVATASDREGVVRLWSARDGRSEGEVELAIGAVHALALSEALLAAADATGRVEVHEVATGLSVDRFELEGRPVGLAFAPDGERLAGASEGGVVRVRAPRAAADRTTRREGAGNVRALAWTGESELVLGLSDGRVLVADPERLVARLPGPVRALSIATGPGLVAAATGDVVRIWSLATRQEFGPPEGHRGAVTALLFEGADLRIRSAGTDGNVLFWEPSGPGTAIARLDAPVLAMAVAARGFVAVAGTTLHFLDPDGHVWNRKLESEGPLGPLAVEPASGRIASAVGALVRIREPGGDDTGLDLGPHPGRVTAAAFGPGGLLVSGDAKGFVHLWDLAKEKYLAPLRAHSGPVESIVVEASGAWIASSARGEPVRVWDARRRSLRRELPAGAGPLAGRPDGRLLAFSDPEGRIRLFDPVSGLEWRPLDPGGARVRVLEFGPGGTRLAAGLEDGTIAVYEVID